MMGAALRPHTKTHKCPEIALMQLRAGAGGITVAKVGEAEEMAKHGITDIFIANEVVGDEKLIRVRELNRKIDISVGVDSVDGVNMIERIFRDEKKTLDVLIEVEVGENRSGVTSDAQMTELVDRLKNCRNVRLKGVFSHEGHTYRAKDIDDCLGMFEAAQRRTVDMAALVRARGLSCDTVSVGATPSLMLCKELMPGVTELRPGTYALMDASQGNALGTHSRCAATVLTSVISKPTDERFITDAGAKALTMQCRSIGICATDGVGLIKCSGGVTVTELYDEHGIIYNKRLSDMLNVGDKIEIIPNHICPVCNLYDYAWLVSGGQVVRQLEISCRGKLT